MKFTIYHIKGVKIGCTRHYPNRIINQGFSIDQVEILEEHEDIDVASIREVELQKQYGYKVDKNLYKTHQALEIRAVANKNISKALKGKPFTEQHLKNLKGKPKSEEGRKNIGLAGRGRIVSQETRDKLSKVGTGRIVSRETRDKIGLANKGNTFKHTEEAKKKISLAGLHRKHSEKSINLMKSKKWITNGIENRKIGLDDIVPDGFRFGRFFREKRKTKK